MNIADFDYNLPEHLIARYPLDNRSDSRLLHLDNNGNLNDEWFKNLPNFFNAGDLIVFNDTKVMKARLFGQKSTGGKIEILVERLISDIQEYQAIFNGDFPHLALCHIKASKAPKQGNVITLDNCDECLMVLGRLDNLFIVGFKNPILLILETYGELPIPPYFERNADDNDDTRYQTVFHNPQKLASVAAPTASLHFDDDILAQLKHKGVNTAFVTLNVGAGTFAPVKTNNIFEHKMHKEYAELPQSTADLINQTKLNGGRIIAVGTTVTRVLETAYLHQVKNANTNNKTLSYWAGDTDIFIYPSFQFGVVDTLITNFHLPKSTLLMLVSAFCGIENIKLAYQHAIDNHYRFFSYGDAMLLQRQSQP